ncbi:EAL domain-containing protein [Phenylobacterium sp. J426]|uniref:EAL domain-containing protein n=1 Tax=Phenylobacterium sp. J426 TaxID=2898439 RepID=UPI0021510222|nr:EAL domain-containing protein [Phenylobacterium sp. J426]MCR5874939.1 EAL domain-containing protein [Phenylobacterium sp. J426]
MSHRMLGFAFAGADLLLEIGADGRIAFALGASETLSGEAETSLSGRPWRQFVARADHAMVAALLDGLEPGSRAGPLVVSLAAAEGKPIRRASLCALRLPQNGGAVSCAFARAGGAAGEGLLSRADFEAMAAKLADDPGLELALVELAGLSAALDAAPEDERGPLTDQLSGVLRSLAHRGEAATDLGEDRFALVRAKGEDARALQSRLKRLIELPVTPEAGVIAMGGVESSKQAIKALRFALNSFVEEGLTEARPETLGQALDTAIEGALTDARALGATIRDRQFRLTYQPVIRLMDGRVSHHEVLVRFGEEASPFPTIRAAEEMDLIEPLDLAILEEALDVLEAQPKTSLAVNISGRTIASDAFVARAEALLKARPTVKDRLILEITESAAIDDLAAADRRLQALRAAGCEVCLDDFGAGAASLAYLQQLTIDILKIDGRYIRELQHGGRESTFIRHLVNLCRELDVKTLAEMVETADAERAVRLAGVDYAQGWYYGAAADTPELKVKPPAIRPALAR